MLSEINPCITPNYQFLLAILAYFLININFIHDFNGKYICFTANKLQLTRLCAYPGIQGIIPLINRVLSIYYKAMIGKN